MTDCQHLESELWAWQEDPAAHPSHLQFEAHVSACPQCRASLSSLRLLRQSLKGLSASPGPDFETRLATALQAATPATRFEADPFLGEAPMEPAGQVLDRRQRAFWVRPLSLVAAGAAAALVVGVLGRWSTGDTPPTAQRSPAPVSQVAELEKGLSADTVGTVEKEGLLAERPWQEDSAKAAASQPDSRERLTPVTARP